MPWRRDTLDTVSLSVKSLSNKGLLGSSLHTVETQPFFMLATMSCFACVRGEVMAPSKPVPKELLSLKHPHTKALFKQFCKEQNLCVRCTFMNPTNPMRLSENGLDCPYCDDQVGGSP